MNSLEKQIADLASTVTGTISVDIRHLESGVRIAHNAEYRVMSASVIKVPVLVELYRQVDEGKLSLSKTIELRDEYKVGGSGILDQMHPGLKLTLRDVAALMIVVSDNTGTNMIIDQVGVESVNARMAELGLKSTYLARRLMDLEAARRGVNNFCSAADISLLLSMIAAGTAASAESCKDMLKILHAQQFKDKIGLMLPNHVDVACKSGWFEGVSHDSGIVFAKSGRFVISVMTEELKDIFEEHVVIAKITRMAYDYFEGGASS